MTVPFFLSLIRCRQSVEYSEAPNGFGLDARGPEWQVQLKARSQNPDSMHVITSHQLTQPFTTFSRLTGYCWLKIEYRNDCAAFYSTDGQTWLRAGNIPLNRTLFSQAGIMVNSNLEAFTTKVKFDHVDIK